MGWPVFVLTTFGRYKSIKQVIKRFREHSKTTPTQANQSFRYLRALLNWAQEKYANSDGTYPVLPIN